MVREHVPAAGSAVATVGVGGGSELRLLLPELVRQAPALPALVPMDAEGQRFRLFEAVSAFLAAIPRSQPVRHASEAKGFDTVLIV